MIHVCVSCRKESSPDEKFLRCSACRIVRYCSLNCQRAHWPSHKHVCPEQARIHEQDRFVTKLNDLFYGRYATIGSLAMILLGTDPEEYSRKCIVMHVKDEDGRAKVIAAHTGVRAHGDEEHWTRRDGMAAAKPETLTMVVEFLHAKDSVVRMYSRLFGIDSYVDMADSVAVMREDKAFFVQMSIDSLNE
jgi:hypothetical protein